MTNNNDQNSIFNKYQIEIAQSLFNREIDKITDEATHNLSDLDHLKNYNDLCLKSEPIIDNIKDCQEKINKEIKRLLSIK
jgi:hypothetical protein